MSRYLVQRIQESPKIRVRTRTQIVALSGEGHLERVTCLDDATGERQTHDVRHVFMMTGAKPNTDWLQRCVTLDEKGFVKTGVDLTADDLSEAKWPLARRPYLLETSLPGIFAVGDVRSESVKRVAAAVGDGSTCIQLVHRVLAEGH
jgi:thioredoxin reductase (NADPH)